MRNRTYGGVRGRKMKVGGKLLHFPPTRFLECNRAVAHAACGSEGGQSRREDADDDLQNGLLSGFPSCSVYRSSRASASTPAIARKIPKAASS